MATNFFGNWLRELSLSGSGGNAAAWAIVLTLSALPLALAVPLLWRKKQKADWLLLLLPPEIFAGLYFAVNPTLAGPAGAFFPVAALGAVGSTLLAWAVLRVLQKLADAPAEKLARALGALLLLCGGVLALSAGWTLFTGWQADAEMIRAANTGAAAAANRTVAIQGFLALLRFLPYLLGAAAFFWGGRLAVKLGADPFGEEALALADRTARLCRFAAGAMVLLELVTNLLQLLLYTSLRDSSFHLELELAPLAVTAALYLLCRYFRAGRALRQDNDSII